MNLVELVARIERQQAETRKFVAEQNKLAAEAAKFHRDRFLAPILATVATLGAIAAWPRRSSGPPEASPPTPSSR